MGADSTYLESYIDNQLVKYSNIHMPSTDGLYFKSSTEYTGYYEGTVRESNTGFSRVYKGTPGKWEARKDTLGGITYYFKFAPTPGGSSRNSVTYQGYGPDNKSYNTTLATLSPVMDGRSGYCLSLP